ncbi:hypothetical protein J3Q64DRAFT_1757271 [Phycomyces blakesleeanus]|uniref:Uncharacterized protein n=1 Tax=Phycomyces blakesleeanus TaxID=4837 RepID=A0ABR3AW24_PHYBL
MYSMEFSMNTLNINNNSAKYEIYIDFTLPLFFDFFFGFIFFLFFFFFFFLLFCVCVCWCAGVLVCWCAGVNIEVKKTKKKEDYQQSKALIDIISS